MEIINSKPNYLLSVLVMAFEILYWQLLTFTFGSLVQVFPLARLASALGRTRINKAVKVLSSCSGLLQAVHSVLQL